jgi:hypothetical protein
MNRIGYVFAASALWIVGYCLSLVAADIPTDGLKLWFRADSGVVKGTGDKVSKWTDVSGSGHDASQSNENQQPLIVTGVLGGKPVVRFDGVRDANNGDMLNFSGLDLNGGNQVTVAIVSANTRNVRNEDSLGMIAQGQSGKSEGGGHGDWHSVFYIAENCDWGMLSVNPLQGCVNVRIGTGQVEHPWRYERPTSLGNAFSRTLVMKNAENEYIYVDGEMKKQVSDKLPQIKCLDAGKQWLGRGPWQHPEEFFPGDIAEIICYNRALSSTEVTTVDTYLKNKYFPETRISGSIGKASVINSGSAIKTSWYDLQGRDVHGLGSSKNGRTLASQKATVLWRTASISTLLPKKKRVGKKPE